MSSTVVGSYAHRAARFAGLIVVGATAGVGPTPAGAAPGPGPGEDPARAEARFSFSRSYVGLSLSYAPNPGRLESADDTFIDLPSMLAPRLVVGGLTFWGHADMYVALSPFWYRADAPEAPDTRLVLGLETGLKVYPFALSAGTLRPFAGIGWAVNTYSQGNGPTITIHQVPIMVGAAWRTRLGIFEVGASIHTLDGGDYPLGRNVDDRVRFNPEILDIWFGYKWAFDSSAKALEEARSGRMAARYKEFEAAGKLSGWEIALGPSTAFPISESIFAGDGAFLSGLRPPGFVPDAAVGYYWHSVNATVRANYRFFFAQDDGYGRTHSYRRHSLSLDALKFIVDYYGFVPFVGGGVSFERLDYDVDDDETGETLDDGAFKAALSVVLGWEFRPFETNAWVLRTNLRLTPGLDLRTNGDNVAFDHVEINFIQLVLYPERLF